jgi:structural maintenance of chromosome 1
VDELKQQIRDNRGNFNNANEVLKKSRVDFEQIKRERSHIFTAFIDKISTNIDRNYKLLTASDASQAFLMPENAEEPYLDGIRYSCIPPGKVFQPITSLSGGEKCLAAFAFIFSCYSESLPTFFILDEIDGALDNKNVGKVGKS